MDRLLLKPDEVAAALGMSRSKTYELIAAGTLPSVTVGGSVRVPADALRDWVARRSRAAAEVVAGGADSPRTRR